MEGAENASCQPWFANILGHHNIFKFRHPRKTDDILSYPKLTKLIPSDHETIEKYILRYPKITQDKFSQNTTPFH
jgi:hypothetical protein